MALPSGALAEPETVLVPGLGHAPPATEASQVGTHWPATVLCNPYQDQITLHAAASAADGFNAQVIYYRYYMYQDGLGWQTWAENGDALASSWRWFVHQPYDPASASHTPYQVSDADVFDSSDGDASLAVMTEYAWQQADGTFVYAPAVWSSAVTYLYFSFPADTPWCNLTLSMFFPTVP